MAGKGKGKGKRKLSKAKGGNGGGEKKEKKKSKRSVARRSGGGRSAKGRCNIDIFSEAAMENAYYTCHNIQDVLKIRGFNWPDAAKKKKKGKGKGKK